MGRGTGSDRIRPVAFRSRVERPIPRSRQALSPSLQTACSRARTLAQFQIRASPEGYFVLVPSEAGFQTPALSARHARPREYAWLILWIFPAQLQARVLRCLLDQQAVALIPENWLPHLPSRSSVQPTARLPAARHAGPPPTLEHDSLFPATRLQVPAHVRAGSPPRM